MRCGHPPPAGTPRSMASTSQGPSRSLTLGAGTASGGWAKPASSSQQGSTCCGSTSTSNTLASMLFGFDNGGRRPRLRRPDGGQPRVASAQHRWHLPRHNERGIREDYVSAGVKDESQSLVVVYRTPAFLDIGCFLWSNSGESRNYRQEGRGLERAATFQSIHSDSFNETSDSFNETVGPIAVAER